MVSFPCPLCKSPVQAEGRHTAYSVDCRQCGGRVQVPPLARHAGEPLPLPSRRGRSAFWIVGVVGLVVGIFPGLLAGCLVGHFLWTPKGEPASVSSAGGEQASPGLAGSPKAPAVQSSTSPYSKTVTLEEVQRKVTGMNLRQVNEFMGPPDESHETIDYLGDHLRQSGFKNIQPARPRLAVTYMDRVIDTRTNQRKTVTLYLSGGVVESFIIN
jgi:hypothetical protein